jgi:hypothetical protein
LVIVDEGALALTHGAELVVAGRSFASLRMTALPDVVRGMARSSVREGGVVFEDRGEREMKGVGEAVRVYVVRTDGVRGPE